ncbi:MAG: 16S rRNA (guanine(527)-N(7))-methyltransferase RsmG [Gammaproteobacteria bacterium]|jgi:16S rRNA (guanine527-N7)-methyltransferase|nr:16S rRNA (guanine(527)-N(7))-methyltransferase RsmG [Gammaproteobacteria bacterium]
MNNGLPAECKRLLTTGCAVLQIELSTEQENLLLGYTEQLYKWNKAYNLTAIRKPEEMLKLHILDSLSVLQKLAELQPERVIDVGTGPGLPGIILAIMWPQVEIHLLDTNGKKTRFLNHCKHLLALENVTVLNKRVEQHQPEQGYDIVVSRAFASISDMLEGCDQLVASKGLFTPMKGQYPQAELAAMPSSYKLVSSTELQVPGVDAARHLLIIHK